MERSQRYRQRTQEILDRWVEFGDPYGGKSTVNLGDFAVRAVFIILLLICMSRYAFGGYRWPALLGVIGTLAAVWGLGLSARALTDKCRPTYLVHVS
jgi:hypothetical protein